MSDRRLIAAVLALVVLLGAGAVDRWVPETEAAAGPSMAGSALAPPSDALTSTWYCGIGGATASSPALGEVIVGNPGELPLEATVTVVPATDAEKPSVAKSQRVRVAPRSRVATRMSDVVDAPYAAAIVEVAGGGAIVEHGVGGALGFDLEPCLTTPTTRWYLAEGSTTRASTLLLSLFNPFPEDAIADLSFATDQGRAVPADFQGVVVPPRSLVVVNVGDHVRRRAAIATTVRARSGRLVVEKLQVRDEPGQRGLVLSAALPAPATTWWFPEGAIRDGQVERFHIYNPSRREAEIDVELTLDEGAVEPFEQPVGPGQRVTVVVNDREDVPRAVGHSATVASLNGVAVVVERTIDANDELDGRAGGGGITRLTKRWAFSAGAATPGVEEWIAIQNPGRNDARVTIGILSQGRLIPDPTLASVVVPAGGRRAVLLNDTQERSELAITVTSTEPVAVERALYRVGRVGLSIDSGVMLRS